MYAVILLVLTFYSSVNVATVYRVPVVTKTATFSEGASDTQAILSAIPLAMRFFTACYLVGLPMCGISPGVAHGIVCTMECPIFLGVFPWDHWIPVVHPVRHPMGRPIRIQALQWREEIIS